jgi:hypothetical protein
MISSKQAGTSMILMSSLIILESNPCSEKKLARDNLYEVCEKNRKEGRRGEGRGKPVTRGEVRGGGTWWRHVVEVRGGGTWWSHVGSHVVASTCHVAGVFFLPSTYSP